jgi:hypothetical protein
MLALLPPGIKIFRFEVVPQPVGQLPWGHIHTILGKIKGVDPVLFELGPI